MDTKYIIINGWALETVRNLQMFHGCIEFAGVGQAVWSKTWNNKCKYCKRDIPYVLRFKRALIKAERLN